jgi:hypothetical protein
MKPAFLRVKPSLFVLEKRSGNAVDSAEAMLPTFVELLCQEKSVFFFGEFIDVENHDE